MRLAVFVFSILLIFSTTYAHAIVWLPAVSGAVVRTGAGKVIKVASKTAFMSGATIAVVNYCKKNKEKCKNILGDTVEYFFDDDDDQCGLKPYYRTSTYKGYDLDIAIHASINEISTAYKRTYVSHVSDNIKNASNEIKSRIASNSDKKFIPIVATDYFIYQVVTVNNTYQGRQSYSVTMEVKSTCDDATQQQKEVQKQAQIQKIIQNLSDDDITYIINNYGDQIDIDKYCTTPNACAELEQAFGDEVMNNKGKYDIDRINKDNCEVKNDKIISCDNAKINKDDDDSDTPKDGDDGQDGQDGDDTKPKDKDKPIKCDSSPFHKKICDFIEWTQTDDDPPDTKLDIEKPNTLKNKDPNINFVSSCPAPYTLDFVIDFGFIGSKEVSITLLDTPKLCNFLDTWIKPIMLVLGPLHAIYILGGSREI